MDENYFEEDGLTKLKNEGYEVLKKINGYIKYLRKCKIEVNRELLNQYPISV